MRIHRCFRHSAVIEQAAKSSVLTYLSRQRHKHFVPIQGHLWKPFFTVAGPGSLGHCNPTNILLPFEKFHQADDISAWCRHVRTRKHLARVTVVGFTSACSNPESMR